MYIVSLLILAILTFPSTTGERFKRIIGGIPVNEEIFPAAVYISYKGRHICGGTRIQDFVLTVAHCVVGPLAHGIQIQQRGGGIGQYKVLKILKISSHKYNRSTSENDIALLYIGTADVDFNHKVGFFPLPIKLPSRNYKPGGLCFVSGPGVRNKFGIVEDDIGKLHGALMPVVPHWRCRKALGRYMAPARNIGLFCAGSGLRDACQGDSGSALLCLDKRHSYWILAGLVSYGMGCGVIGTPGVFTNVAYHRDWIGKQMRIIRMKYRNL